MKFVVSSDYHLDHVSNGRSRFREIREAVMHTVNVAVQEKAAAWIFLGDAMNPDSGPDVFPCLKVLQDAAFILHENGIESIAITGNHDVIERGAEFGPASTLMMFGTHPMRLFDQPIVSSVAGVEVLALPFTSTAFTYDPEKFVKEMVSLKASRPLFVLSHLNIRGVVPGSETHEMPRGRDVWLPDEAISEVAKHRSVTVLSGHYHRQQVHVTPSGLPVHIVGSVARMTHGEETNSPGYFVIDG